MNQINPNAILLIAFTTLIGALLGHALLGAALGVGFVLFATIFGR